GVALVALRLHRAATRGGHRLVGGGRPGAGAARTSPPAMGGRRPAGAAGDDAVRQRPAARPDRPLPPDERSL
ncbi:MAG: hypothetical protein AVDCRST_MAG61-3415, partial [uncultured Friedmanniella sp.]